MSPSRIVVMAAIFAMPLAVGAAQTRTVPAESKAYQVYRERVEYFLRGSGRWRAANPTYDSTSGNSLQFFGYRFTRDSSPNLLRLQISGGVGTSAYQFWNGYYYWHPVRNRVVYHALAAPGTSGAIAVGEGLDEAGSLIFEIIGGDGSVELHRDEELRLNESEFVSTSYRLKNGKWEFNQRLVWKRQ